MSWSVNSKPERPLRRTRCSRKLPDTAHVGPVWGSTHKDSETGAFETASSEPGSVEGEAHRGTGAFYASLCIWTHNKGKILCWNLYSEKTWKCYQPRTLNICSDWCLSVSLWKKLTWVVLMPVRFPLQLRHYAMVFYSNWILWLRITNS